ncbi:aryl-alcohol dehydrogenase (NADP+) [Stella humosa]|uniref:Aryl-alcohol dehydrogenase (NADP+) n=1 Tax=Stella humosa TaxID=94 RepID=A0A3N1KPI2_9PROT|nr:aldo/keto reductase [Stella humosa]ROP81202.1 aryl-alcohol dehydrogenase (NADP+) [Stella humosa]BBK32549.1 oxidoreductase [Stella humosa]
MQYRPLGRSGLRVSPICLGTMMFGDRTEQAEAARIVDIARDAGINFVDTADVYTRGASERMLGPLIAKDRDSWVVATKVGNPMGKGANQGNHSRKWLMHEIDQSLGRLGTDHIDLWYLHVDDQKTPLAETLGAIADIIRAGKVRYWGVSNFTAWRLAEACHVAREVGLPLPVASQPLYNAVNRQVEAEHLPACDFYGLGVVPYSPVARGVLTGKYGVDGTAPEGSRAAIKDRRMMETEFRPESFAIAQQIVAHARSRNISPTQFAILWLLRNKLVSSVIAGPRTVEQWQEYLGALEHALDDVDEKAVDALVKPGHASTHGYTDPKYPVQGRVVG